MYRPVLVIAPAAATTLITLAQAKAHLREDSSDQDSVINALIGAAVSHLDGWTGILGRCLLTQTWRQDFDSFSQCLRLPLAPVSAIASVKYDDTGGVEQTVSSNSYALLTDELGSYVRFVDTFAFPSIEDQPASVRVAYAAGYADADAVPQAIKQGILLAIGHWYANREAVTVGVVAAKLPMACEALWAPWRRMRF